MIYIDLLDIVFPVFLYIRFHSNVLIKYISYLTELSLIKKKWMFTNYSVIPGALV